MTVCIVIVSWTLYANAAILISDSADYRYFPPFEPDRNDLMTSHLGAEYLNIAQALRAGRGYADPFRAETGPTAWMPPVLPTILAGQDPGRGDHGRPAEARQGRSLVVVAGRSRSPGRGDSRL